MTTDQRPGGPVIVAAARSPIGTAGGRLSDVDAAGLAVPVLRRLAQVVPAPVEEVVLGNCTGPGGNVGRVAALASGLGTDVPALTVDRQCASGLAAVAVAAAQADQSPGLYLAGGTESASTAPWRFWPPAPGQQPRRYERAPFAPAELGDPDMGPAADLLARRFGITRERQDGYAARSHQRAYASARRGAFDDEIVPLGEVVTDERPRAGMTPQRLSRLRPAFAEGGTVTAGNSCGVNDGAAAVALVDAGTHRRLGSPGLRVLACATAAVDSRLPGLGLVPAVRLALKRAEVELDEVDVVELNEAFAGQVLACCDELGLDDRRVCPQGGALALGHPWGASGAVLVVRLFSQMLRQQAGSLGLAAIAAGGGQGVAMVVQRCP